MVMEIVCPAGTPAALRAAVKAAISPAGPAPTTSTSQWAWRVS